jgi:putative PEP-CTERM system TPR-repeat lipoprotein
MADALVTKFPSSADAWVAKGNVEYASGKLRDAVASFDRAVALDPGAGNVRIVRASALLDLGDYQAAADALASLRKASARDPQINYLYAQALYKLGRSVEATKLMAEAAEVVGAAAPDVLGRHPPSLLLAGLILYGNRQYEQAYNLLNAYLQIDREHFEVRKLVAAALIALNKPRDAIELLRPALIREVPDPQLYLISGEAYARTGQHARATEAFEQALALRPDDPKLRAQLGLARVAEGDRKQGMADIEAAVTDSPDALGTSLYLGMLKLADRDPASARDVAARVVEREPANLTALNLLASAQLALGDRATARQSYEKALAVDPKYRPAHINLAHIDLMEGRPDAAEQRLAPLLADDPNNPRLMYEMALVEDARRRPDVALHWLEKAYAADRTSLTVAPRLADAYLRTGQPSKASSVVIALVQTHGETPLVAELLARAQLATGAVEDARLTLKRLAALTSYDTSGLIRTADLQLLAGDREGAWWSLDKAVAGDEQSLPARSGLGALSLSLGKADIAREQAEQLTRRFPDHPAGHALKGDLAMAERRFGDAVVPYRTAQQKADTAALAIRLMQAQSAAGRIDAAVTELEAWVVNHPDSLVAKRALAEAHHAAGNLLKAKAVYEELAEKTPNDAAVLNNLAEIYGALGDVRSLALARRAHELAPKNPAILDTFGWALVRLGEPEKGLAYLRDAMSRLATSGEIRYHLAVALAELGRIEEAIRELTAALEQEDLASRADAERHLARLKAATR